MKKASIIGIRTVDHWAAHPEWKPWRRHLAAYIVFEKSSVFAKAAKKVQADLADAPVALCPPDSLHQTLQCAGWEDELTFAQVEAVRRNAAAAVRRVTEFDLYVSSFEFAEDAVIFRLEPPEPLLELKALLHDAVSRALGERAEGESDDILPHMTVAYCNRAADAGPLFAAVEKHSAIEAGPYRVKHVELVWLSRESDRYRWETIERMPLDEE